MNKLHHKLMGIVKRDRVGTVPNNLKEFKNVLRFLRVPTLHSQDRTHINNIMLYVKIFDPFGSWSLCVAEWDGKDRICGMVSGKPVFKYFSLTSLSEFKGRTGLGLTIDVWFKPKTVSNLMLTEA